MQNHGRGSGRMEWWWSVGERIVSGQATLCGVGVMFPVE